MSSHGATGFSISSRINNWFVNNKVLGYVTWSGLLVAVLGLLLVLFPSATSKIAGFFAPFTAKVDVSLCGDTRDARVPFYIVYGRLGTNYLAPVNALLHIVIVNKTKHPLVIDAYGVEAKTDDGSWATLVRIPKMQRPAYVLLNPNPLTGLRMSDFTQFFDNELDRKTIQPYETVQGWAFFEYPRAFSASTFKGEYRVTIHTFSGIDFTSEPHTPLPDQTRSPVAGVQDNGLGTIPPPIDLSGYSIKFYEDALTESQLPPPEK